MAMGRGGGTTKYTKKLRTTNGHEWIEPRMDTNGHE